MNISGQVIPRGNTVLRSVRAALSLDARRRLLWMDFYDRHGQNARLTCRHFGISPDVFYRWRRRYDPRRLPSLEDDRRTRRPRRVRQCQTKPVDQSHPPFGSAIRVRASSNILGPEG